MLTLHRDPSAEARAIFLTGAPSLSVSGLSITGGHTNGLGGVFFLNSGAKLVLDTVVLTGNSSAQGGGAITVYTAQVPLRREAIQIVAAGPGVRAAAVLATLNQVLGSLKGETNWLSPTERAARLGTIAGWIIGIAIGVLIVRFVVTRRRAQSVA